MVLWPIVRNVFGALDELHDKPAEWLSTFQKAFLNDSWSGKLI